MTKSRTSRHLKEAPAPPTVSVQVPLPMLLSLEMARQSFLDVCISAGLEVLARGMEEDRTALCGAPKGKHHSERQAVRWGETSSEVTLGGRRIPISRPRVRGVDGGEQSLPWFEWATERDPLNLRTLEEVAIGVSMRNYARALETLPADVSERAVITMDVPRREGTTWYGRFGDGPWVVLAMVALAVAGWRGDWAMRLAQTTAGSNQSSTSPPE